MKCEVNEISSFVAGATAFEFRIFRTSYRQSRTLTLFYRRLPRSPTELLYRAYDRRTAGCTQFELCSALKNALSYSLLNYIPIFPLRFYDSVFPFTSFLFLPEVRSHIVGIRTFMNS